MHLRSNDERENHQQVPGLAALTPETVERRAGGRPTGPHPEGLDTHP